LRSFAGSGEERGSLRLIYSGTTLHVLTIHPVIAIRDKAEYLTG
jgi:hypothetical protein